MFWYKIKDFRRSGVHILICMALAFIVLGSGLILQTGYAQTSDLTRPGEHSVQGSSEFELKTFDPWPGPEAGRFGVQTEPGQQSETDDIVRQVTVSGSGQATAAPDRAVIRLGVQTQADQADQALSQNSSRMQNLITTLKESDVLTDQIQTQSIQLRPIYDQQPGREDERQVTGYMAENLVEVTVTDLDRLGEIVDAAVEAGGNTVQGIRFEVSNPVETLEQARVAAMSDARDKAEQLAALAEAELGQVLTINETTRTPRPVVQESMMMAAEAAATPIEPGTQSLQVDVQVSWLLR